MEEIQMMQQQNSMQPVRQQPTGLEMADHVMQQQKTGYQPNALLAKKQAEATNGLAKYMESIQQQAAQQGMVRGRNEGFGVGRQVGTQETLQGLQAQYDARMAQGLAVGSMY